MPSGYKHGDTPKRAMVRGTISYLESQGLPVNKSAIFRHFELSRSQGYAALNIPASRRNDPEWEETRGRPSKITEADQQKMESILWDEQYENVNLNWSKLAKEAGLETECNARTLHRTMGTMGYRRCMGCSRCWVHKKTREKRVEHAERMLETFAQPQDWHAVRFSGELHFGFGLDGKVRLLPKLGEKYCQGCTDQPVATAWARDIKRVHAWAAIGYDFKSELLFYDESTSPNNSGVISMQDYCDKVLDGVVKTWILAEGAQPFVLEEDIESFSHGAASNVNPAQQWKEENGLRCHFNCLDSPDLNPLDSLWPPHKQWATQPLENWDTEGLKQAVRDAWANIEQPKVNAWVDSMPQRLRQVVENEGKMFPW
jgi:hypothetical protein